MSTLEEPLRETIPSDAWGEDFARTLDAQRERAQQLLQEERDRIRRVETTLAEQMQLLAAELTQQRSESSRHDDDLIRRTAQLEDKAAHLERLQTDLAQREHEWRSQQSQFTQQQQSWLEDLREQFRQLEA